MNALSRRDRWLAFAAVVVVVAVACGAWFGDHAPPGQSARYRQLHAAIEERRGFDVHCLCRAYHGGLCGSQAASRLGLGASDVPLLEELGSTDDYQVAAAVADLLASVGPPGGEALARLRQRRDEVGEMLRGPGPPGGDARCTTVRPY